MVPRTPRTYVLACIIYSESFREFEINEFKKYLIDWIKLEHWIFLNWINLKSLVVNSRNVTIYIAG